MKSKMMLLASALAVAVTCAAAHAGEITYTTIHVEKMCCQGCVQKVAAQLYAVKGVKEVRANLPKRIVYVVPQQGKLLSPRAMWTAIENADDRPLKLAGPTGVYTEKPNQ